MKLIVGLGNPGKMYQKTRHNVGFMVLDALQDSTSTVWSSWEISKKLNAEISTGIYQDEKIILLKPLTFMNESGLAVQLAMHFYKIKPEDIVVVHDDKDIILGDLKIQTDRGHAGHNGVRSIIEQTNTQNFTRMRIGIGSAREEKIETVDFVLSKFGLLERRLLERVMTTAIEKIRAWYS